MYVSSLVLTIVALAIPSALAQQRSDTGALPPHDQRRLVEAELAGKQEIVLLLAVDRDRIGGLLVRAMKSDSRVQYRNDAVGYLRIKVPIQQARELADAPEVIAAMIDGPVVYPLDEPIGTRRIASADPSSAIPGPGKATPQDNPYLPTRSIRATELIGEKPTYDGRGVTVAIVDETIDYLSPQLRHATDVNGNSVRKFADILTSLPDAQETDDDAGGSSFIPVPMDMMCTANGGRLSCQGKRYGPPRDGEFRFGILSEHMKGGRADLDADGNPPGSNGSFPILWSETSKQIWIDTDQDGDFADERPLTDYGAGGEIGLLGRDDPATEIRESTGFAVQTDPVHKRVIVIPGTGVHGTAVAGGAFGRGFFGGALNGVAPGAQLVSIPFGRSIHGVLEALIAAFKHPQVDVVTFQHVLIVPFADGSSTFAVISNRLVETYGKLLISSAGNSGDELTRVMEAAAASYTIAVGSYVDTETSAVSYGRAAPYADAIDLASARGPGRDGGMKPDLLAPSPSLSLFPGSRARLGEEDDAPYPLPPGYCLSGGTSTSAPFFAAAAALVLSAARQERVAVDWMRLRWALVSTARFLPHYGAHEQGAGLVDVVSAWQALKDMPSPLMRISGQGSVNDVASGRLRSPHRGRGIFEREGWTPGTSGTRSLLLTRHNGPQQPVELTIEWKTNSTAFTSARRIILPLGQSAPLEIAIQPRSMGVHSALLQLSDGHHRPVFETLVTIVAAEEFRRDRAFRIHGDTAVPWLDYRSYFFRVPPAARQLVLDVRIGAGVLRPVLMRPDGTTYLPAPDAEPNAFTDYMGPGAWARAVMAPEPGVWQLSLENKRNPLPQGRAAAARASVDLSLAGGD